MEIELTNYLSEKNILLNVKQKDKKSFLSFVLDFLIKNKKIKKEDKKEILKALLQREEMGSTAIGGGVAFPHARLECINNITLCFAISREGVNFDALDQELVYVVVLLLSKQKEASLYLKILAFLAKILREKEFVQKIKELNDPQEVLELIKKQQEFLNKNG